MSDMELRSGRRTENDGDVTVTKDPVNPSEPIGASLSSNEDDSRGVEMRSERMSGLDSAHGVSTTRVDTNAVNSNGFTALNMPSGFQHIRPPPGITSRSSMPVLSTAPSLFGTSMHQAPLMSIGSGAASSLQWQAFPTNRTAMDMGVTCGHAVDATRGATIESQTPAIAPHGVAVDTRQVMSHPHGNTVSQETAQSMSQAVQAAVMDFATRLQGLTSGSALGAGPQMAVGNGCEPAGNHDEEQQIQHNINPEPSSAHGRCAVRQQYSSRPNRKDTSSRDSSPGKRPWSVARQAHSHRRKTGRKQRQRSPRNSSGGRKRQQEGIQ